MASMVGARVCQHTVLGGGAQDGWGNNVGGCAVQWLAQDLNEGCYIVFENGDV